MGVILRWRGLRRLLVRDLYLSHCDKPAMSLKDKRKAAAEGSG
jgi:hypothetical protein